MLAGGTLATLLVAVGALGVGALPRVQGQQHAWLGVDLLRDSAAGRGAATGLAVAGVLLLLTSWLLLRQAPARVQLRAAALWSLPLLLAPPVFSRDVYAYAAQGALVHAGLDPYAVGPQQLPGPLLDSVSAQYAGAPTPYGPVFVAVAGRVVAVTGQHPVAAALLLRVLAVVGLLLLAWALPLLAPQAAGRALWLGLANPLVLLHGVGGAHNEALMAGLLAAGLAVRGRLALAAALVTVGALVKAPALVALAALPVPRLPRGVLVVAAAALGTAVAATLVSGLGTGWLGTALQGTDSADLLSPVYGAGRALQALHVPHGLAAAKALGTGLGLLLAAGVLLAAPRLGPLRAIAGALLALALLAPAFQPWYLLWALPLLAASVSDRSVRALAAGSAVLCLALLPSGRPLLQGPTWGVPVLVALAAAGLAAAPRRTSSA